MCVMIYYMCVMHFKRFRMHTLLHLTNGESLPLLKIPVFEEFP